MSQLHLRILALIGWLIVFFNIERVDFNRANEINLAPGVYIVGMIAVLLPLLPYVARYSGTTLAAFIAGLYVLALALGTRPFIADGAIYLTLAGAFMIMINLVLSYRLGQAVDEFRRAVETVTFSDKARHLRSLAEAREMVDVEMLRSRRTERPLSVLLFQADPSSLNMAMHRLVQELQRSMMQRYVLATTANVLSRHLRRTDVVLEDQQPGRLVLLAPETSEDEAIGISRRVTQLIHDHLGVAVQGSVAAFPRQALTFEDLLLVAEQRLQSQPVTSEEPTESGMAEQHAEYEGAEAVRA